MIMVEGATVAVVDGGGRGAVLAEAYAKSPHVEKVLVIPGNDMVSDLSSKPIVPFPKVRTTDLGKISQILKEGRVTLLDVAQDNAVQAGVGDLGRRMNIATVGPSRAAGMLEYDKTYARQIAKSMRINQPEFNVFANVESARRFLLQNVHKPFFVKAAGLAEGKGAIYATNFSEALHAIDRLKSMFPQAMEEFLLEQPLEGEEFSSFFAVSGDSYKYLGDAQDYKREYDGDRGENTGSMGAVSKPLVSNQRTLQKGREYIVKKTVEAQREIEEPYVGILFLGLMRTDDGVSLIEYNARWGDPEAQVIIPSLRLDFFELGMAIAKGRLSGTQIKRDGKVRVVVTVASRGYPRDFSAVRGREIKSLQELKKDGSVSIYGAGVKMDEGKHYYIDGGRLFYLVAEGRNILEAREKLVPALEIVEGMDGENVRFRKDIGWPDIERLQK